MAPKRVAAPGSHSVSSTALRRCVQVRLWLRATSGPDRGGYRGEGSIPRGCGVPRGGDGHRG